MDNATLYGLTRCSTCVKARKWLDARGIPYTFIDYRDHPLDAATLTRWADRLGWKVLINRASTSWRALSDEQKGAHTDQQWLDLVEEHPTLIKRPVLEAGGDEVMVGFSEARYAAYFD